MDVTTATGPGQALELVADGCFDVMVTDVQMPGMTGLELLDRVHRCVGDLPVVVVTSAVGVDSALDVLRSRAAGFLRKRLDHTELVATVSLLAELGQTIPLVGLRPGLEPEPGPRGPGVGSAAAVPVPAQPGRAQVWSASGRPPVAPSAVPPRPGHPALIEWQASAADQRAADAAQQARLQRQLHSHQRVEGLNRLADGAAHDCWRRSPLTWTGSGTPWTPSRPRPGRAGWGRCRPTSRGSRPHWTARAASPSTWRRSPGATAPTALPARPSRFPGGRSTRPEADLARLDAAGG